MTKRPIGRPKDKNKQKACYSRKKRRHTQKNIVIVSSRKRILVLLHTSDVRGHDYTLLKKSGLLESIPQNIVCYHYCPR